MQLYSWRSLEEAFCQLADEITHKYRNLEVKLALFFFENFFGPVNFNSIFMDMV